MSGTSSHPLPVVRTVADLRSLVRGWRQEGLSVALLPTMGALHAGHLALGTDGLERCDRLITSIFVNPAQFAPEEDFGEYPRTFDDDLRKLAGIGGHAVWAPTAGEMYPEGFATRVTPSGAAEGLETDFRPHFFGGVATVCCKLFTQALPDIALFGEKDYQQLCVVRQMVRDLDLPLQIVGHPTVREADGLAMSSRNAYLSDQERRIAPAIYDVIQAAARDVGDGTPVSEAESRARSALSAAGFETIDYVSVRDAETLAPADRYTGRTLRVLAAAWLGKTRLIDNVACPIQARAKLHLPN